MLARFHPKIGCWLGLLAILMATLAPTVSETLAASHARTLPPAASLCSAHASTDSAPGRDDTIHALAAHWQACGYCDLLAHLPALPNALPAFGLATQVFRYRIAAPFRQVRRVPSCAAGQPRAPPVLS
ncbi:DUF2946 domain-containing protein [Burkholderia alba]|uniref:DUF2946 domain-containing protein n=1 Tax=Burkholderia alba TaxID=2683677 RepID=UPI002B0607CB|nr:DUF2946 domain-containing protein [Burkholderia alba]